jgi:hypothetical protein
MYVLQVVIRLYTTSMYVLEQSMFPYEQKCEACANAMAQVVAISITELFDVVRAQLTYMLLSLVLSGMSLADFFKHVSCVRAHI